MILDTPYGELDTFNEGLTFFFPALVAEDNPEDEQNQQSKTSDGHDHSYQHGPVAGFGNCCREDHQRSGGDSRTETIHWVVAMSFQHVLNVICSLPNSVKTCFHEIILQLQWGVVVPFTGI